MNIDEKFVLYIETEEESAAVQEKAFSLGYGWAGYRQEVTKHRIRAEFTFYPNILNNKSLGSIYFDKRPNGSRNATHTTQEFLNYRKITKLAGVAYARL